MAPPGQRSERLSLAEIESQVAMAVNLDVEINGIAKLASAQGRWGTSRIGIDVTTVLHPAPTPGGEPPRHYAADRNVEPFTMRVDDQLTANALEDWLEQFATNSADGTRSIVVPQLNLAGSAATNVRLRGCVPVACTRHNGGGEVGVRCTSLSADRLDGSDDATADAPATAQVEMTAPPLANLKVGDLQGGTSTVEVVQVKVVGTHGEIVHRLLPVGSSTSTLTFRTPVGGTADLVEWLKPMFDSRFTFDLRTVEFTTLSGSGDPAAHLILHDTIPVGLTLVSPAYMASVPDGALFTTGVTVTVQPGRQQ